MGNRARLAAARAAQRLIDVPAAMDPGTKAQRWQRIKGILGHSLDLPEDQRPGFLRAQAQDTAELGELLSLHAAGAADTGWIDGEGHRHLVAPPPDDTHADWSGHCIGPYRLLGLVARGGMGQVYRAERSGDAPAGTAPSGSPPSGSTASGTSPSDDTPAPSPPQAGPVALKLMREGWVSGALLRRFQAEHQILARLQHPNLARLLDAGMHGAMPYLVMELVEGEPIDRHCARLALDLPAVLRLFCTLCDVVHYAHGQGVVHRDLKPANVLVTQDGQVKLLDFGIAKRLGEWTSAAEGSATTGATTATALRMMTLACASPEQVRGQAVTPASDVYSLGVLLYRLLAGRLPYAVAEGGQAGTDLDLRNAICHLRPPPPSHALQDTPARWPRRALRGNVDAVVAKALAKDPARRYASAAALAADLRRHLAQRPVLARPAWHGRLAAARHWGRAHPVAAGALAVVLASAALLAAHAWTQARQRQQSADAEWARLDAELQAAAVLQGRAHTPADLAPLRDQVHRTQQRLALLAQRAAGDTDAARLALAQVRLALAQAGTDGLGLADPAAAAAALRAAIGPLDRAAASTTKGPLRAAMRQEQVAARAALSALLAWQGQGGSAAEALAREGLALARRAAEGPPQAASQRLLARAELALARVLDPLRAGPEMQALVEEGTRRLQAQMGDGTRPPPAPGEDGAARPPSQVEDATRPPQPQRPAPDIAHDLAADLAAAHRLRGRHLLRADVDAADAAAQAAQAYREAAALLQAQGAGPPRLSDRLALALVHADLALALQQAGRHEGRDQTAAGAAGHQPARAGLGGDQPAGAGPGGDPRAAAGLAEALAAATLARDDLHALWRGAPGLRALQWHLADAAVTLGRLQLAAGRFDAALQTAAGALDALQPPAPEDDSASRLRQGWAWHQLGQALIAQATAASAHGASTLGQDPPPDWLRACDAYRRSLALLSGAPAATFGDSAAADAARRVEMQQTLQTCPAP